MGCDIHMFVERLVDGTWKQVMGTKNAETGRWELDRHYSLFGMLADIRDHNVPAISEPRGIPSDLSSGITIAWENDKEDCHTASFYTLDELFAAKDKTFRDAVYLNVGEYKKFKKTGKIPLFAKTSLPRGVIIVTAERMERIMNMSAFLDENEYFCRYEWNEPYGKVSSQFWEEFIPAIQELDPDPKNVRCVFWFDS